MTKVTNVCFTKGLGEPGACWILAPSALETWWHMKVFLNGCIHCLFSPAVEETHLPLSTFWKFGWFSTKHGNLQVETRRFNVASIFRLYFCRWSTQLGVMGTQNDRHKLVARRWRFLEYFTLFMLRWTTPIHFWSSIRILVNTNIGMIHLPCL